MYKWPVGLNNEQVHKYQGLSFYHMFLEFCYGVSGVPER
jgi:hypothetical protein